MRETTNTTDAKKMTRHSNPTTIGLAIVVAVLFAGAVALAVIVPASAAPTGIDSCTTITASGSYELTADITDRTADTCIEVRASDVSFDGAGHVIAGVDADGTGILVGKRSTTTVENVTITDVTVDGWNVGVRYENADWGNIDGVTARANGDDGISLARSANNQLTSNTATGNGGDGISVTGAVTGPPTHSRIGEGNGLTFNDVRENAENGIRIVATGNNSLIENIAEDNGANGIALHDVSDPATGPHDHTRGNFLFQNRLIDSGAAGVLLDDANDTQVTKNDIVESGGAGIVVANGATGNLINTNRLFNHDNVAFADEFAGNANRWNTSRRPVPSGPLLPNPDTTEFGGQFTGGNYYASPDGTGFSQTCTDADEDGICDGPNGFETGSDTNTDAFALTCQRGPSPGDVTGDGNDAIDPDCDGEYEDVNGDGRFDIVDVQALFANRNDPTVQANPRSFNLNGDTDDDGTPKVDVVDVQRLFVAVT